MQLTTRNLLLTLLTTLLLTGCASIQRVPFPEGGQDYKLGVGDRLTVTVYNQEKLSGVFTINAKGNVALPLIGSTHAAGRTTQELEDALSTALRPKYLNDPRVSIQVTNYRNFYILGQVNKPGKYEYEPDLTLPQAVAIAEGYTPRASEDTATVRRHGDKEILVFDVDNDKLIRPGDIIFINRRLF
ncbi:MAG: hypothetical protein A3B66_06990 [Alphaproteobacteria bacterium RIFCSPHIGHO2_02_FULL_46_13]|nr:MAG: hypothetical protein A3B66_06990 [Alphaproteobacteria bacterium RIFCSPHIGHO2_02_FULL_46_13]